MEEDDISVIKAYLEPEVPIPEGVPTFNMEDYVVVNEIGTSGAGVVWKVKNKSSGELYAITRIFKYSNEVEDGQYVGRIQHDMRLTTSVDHPNIMRCLGVCTNDSGIHFLYNYMPMDLSSFCEKDEHRLAEIAYQLLQGLDYLRKEKKFVFKHLTPSSILFDPVSNIVKISDVGILKDRHITLKHVTIASHLMQYIALENYHKGNDRVCLQSRRYRKSDAWSLGLCLLQLYNDGKYPLDAPYACYVVPGFHTTEPRVAVGKDMWPPKALSDAPPLFSDFIYSCLTIDVSKRADVDDLLTHPFLVSNGFHHPLGDEKHKDKKPRLR